MGHKILIGVLGLVVMITFAYFSQRHIRGVYLASQETFNPEGYKKTSQKELAEEIIGLTKDADNTNWKDFVWDEKIENIKGDLESVILITKNKKCRDASGFASEYSIYNSLECDGSILYRNNKIGRAVFADRNTTCKDLINIGFDNNFDDYIMNDLCLGYRKTTGYLKSKTETVNIKINSEKRLVDIERGEVLSIFFGAIDQGCNGEGFCGGPSFVSVYSKSADDVIYYEDTVGDFECKDISKIKSKVVLGYVKENFCGM
jgi:hypothetical protein